MVVLRALGALGKIPLNELNFSHDCNLVRCQLKRTSCGDFGRTFFGSLSIEN